MADIDRIEREDVRARIIKRTREERLRHESPVWLQRERENRFNKAKDILMIVGLVLIFSLAALFYLRNYTCSTYVKDHELKFGNLKKTEVKAFGSGVVLFGQDALSYVENGTVVWTRNMAFEDPIFVKKGNFFAVCDRNAYEFYICDTTGVLSSAKVSRKIRGMDIASSGVTAVFTQNNEAAYISYFDRFGNRLSVELKSLFTATGFPVHISLSPDGQKLCVLYYSLQNGIGESRMVLYDFQNGKQSDSYQALVLDDFYDSGTLLMDSAFFDNTHFAVLGDQEIRFVTYSYISKSEASTVKVALSENARSALFSQSHLLITEETDDGCTAYVYDTSGKIYSTFEVPPGYDALKMTDEHVIFIKGKDVVYYNLSGRKRYEGSFVSAPVSLDLCRNSVIMNDGEELSRITFK